MHPESLSLPDLVLQAGVILLGVQEGEPQKRRFEFGESALPAHHPLRPASRLDIALYPFRVERALKGGPVPPLCRFMSHNDRLTIDWTERMHATGVSKSYYVPTYDSSLRLALTELRGRRVILFANRLEVDGDLALTAEGSIESPALEAEIEKLLGA